MTQAGLHEGHVQREAALSDDGALRLVTQWNLLDKTDLAVCRQAERTQMTALNTELGKSGCSRRHGESLTVEVPVCAGAHETERFELGDEGVRAAGPTSKLFAG